MRILLTGSAGFIGSHIADALSEAGHEVRGIDALLPQAHGEATTPGWGSEVTRIGRLQDADLLAEQLQGVDVVCHQAAMVGHGLHPGDAPDYAQHNDYATALLLAAMHAAGVHRLVLASSMVVYGEGSYRCPQHGLTPPAPRTQADIEAGQFDPRCPRCAAVLHWQLVPETAALDPRSTYAATKLAQENLAAAWARQSGGSVWALRYHNVYGPRMPRNTPYAGVASLFRSSLEQGNPPTVLEDGHQQRDFVHVSDVARANLLALEQPLPQASLQAVNICSGQPHTVGELAQQLARTRGGPEPEIVGGARAADVRHVVADPAAASELLGFRAEVDFADGIAEFATAPLRESAGFTSR